MLMYLGVPSRNGWRWITDQKSKIGLTQKKSGKRFVAVSTEELSALEKTRNEKSTVASTN